MGNSKDGRVYDTMVPNSTPAMSKQPFIKCAAAITTTADLAPVTTPVGTLPTTSFVYSHQYRSAKLFFGSGGSADTSAKFQVHGYHPVATSQAGDSSGNVMFLPQLIARGTLLAGSATFGASATVYGLMAASGDTIVDSITDTADYPGTYIQGSSLDVTAYIEFPLQGCLGFALQFRCATTANAMTSVSAFAKLQDDTYRPYA